VFRRLAVVGVVGAALVAGCGDDSQPEEGSGGPELGAIRAYLVDHTEKLAGEARELKRLAGEYRQLVASEDGDYRELIDGRCDEVDAVLGEAKKAFVRANPAYEEMEGIVAGVPRLAHYDVDLDAGSDRSDPERAVSFSLELGDGRRMRQPGNLFFLMETALWGTNERLLADGVKPDVDCDGKAEFGEGLPDAEAFVAVTREFAVQTGQLDADAREFEPTPSDALTAIVVMTPTMSEYFGQWKNTAFVAGEGRETEQGFVATSRLSDISDILEGIRFTYAEVEPLIAADSPARAAQTRRELRELLRFADGLRNRERAGERFSARQADQLGSEAQARAEAIAGQVTQSAQQLGVELQES
jgi:Imelysin